MHRTLYFLLFLNVLTYIFITRRKLIPVFVYAVKGLGRKLPPIWSVLSLQFFMSMGTELLSLKGGRTAFLGNAHWTLTFCRVFWRCPRTCSFYAPWKPSHPHELLPFLMHFLSFLITGYHVRELKTEQHPPRNDSSLCLKGCVSLVNADWLPRMAEEGQAEDHRGQ